MPPKRKGLTAIEKYDLCMLRSKHPKMKLSEFALLPECPKRDDSKPLAASSLCEHLKRWEERVAEGPPTGEYKCLSKNLWENIITGNKGPESQKKKARKAQFPIFEFLLVKWIDAAEYERVPVTDDVIRSQAIVIQQTLSKIGCEEDYTNFELSQGWLARFKERHTIGRLKRHGESGSVDERCLPVWRRNLQHQLADFAPKDRWNCDESGLQYNKQPSYSNVRKEKGKILSGIKLDKTRVTTFHCVNSDGSEKRRITVIGRAQTPQAFRQQNINPANLPITYRYNKKSWMLTGLWYEFLRAINDEMRISGRHIALITDNCPTHPLPEQPPLNYTGPPPPVMTNVTLIYLPPNTTSKLQPLDQGIIASFKAAYRRNYADYMVKYFNLHQKAPPKLDILSAIYLIADAWESIPASTIINCWRKSGIISDMVPEVDTFLTESHSMCRIALRQIYSDLDEDIFNDGFNNFVLFDEDIEDFDKSLSDFPDAVALVERNVQNGLLLYGPENMEQSELDADGDLDLDFAGFKPCNVIITHDKAIENLHELTRYLQTLKVSCLETPTGRVLSVPELVEKTSHLVSAIAQYAPLSYHYF